MIPIHTQLYSCPHCKKIYRASAWILSESTHFGDPDRVCRRCGKPFMDESVTHPGSVEENEFLRIFLLSHMAFKLAWLLVLILMTSGMFQDYDPGMWPKIALTALIEPVWFFICRARWRAKKRVT
jgi:hypothetical protein